MEQTTDKVKNKLEGGHIPWMSTGHFPLDCAGCEVVSLEPHHAVCKMPNRPIIQNELGYPMGGALFTLADFTFASACNCDPDRFCITQGASVSYLRSSRGEVIFAEATCLHSGRNTCVYSVELRDESGVHLAQMTFTGYYLYPNGEKG